MKSYPLLAAPTVVSLCALLLAGCVSVEEPAYRIVDHDTPAFKQAVAIETQRQQEQGKSLANAEEIATGKVTRQTIKAEKDRRIEQVTPLVAALADLDRSRGCWAYTVTTTTREPGQTTLDVERYDASQPEERLWTLVTRNGATPDETTQAGYRRAKMRVWIRQLHQPSPRFSKSESLKLAAVGSDLVVTASDPTGATTFTFNRGHAHVPPFGDIPRMREVYVTDNASNTVLSHSRTHLEPAGMLGGAIKMDTWDNSTDYIVIEPRLPPFVAQTTTHYRGRIFGKDTGDVEIASVYSDYRRVKCYDDRFEVRIGEPTMIDFLPVKD